MADLNTRQTLALRRRPFRLEDVVGQESAVQTVRGLVDRETAPNAFLITGPSGTGKALCDDTPIPTWNGWKRMGDLERGDVLFDERGHPCSVLSVHPQGGRALYKLTFDDGSTLLADGDHLWKTVTVWNRNVKGRTKKRWQDTKPITTREMATDFKMTAKRAVHRYAIPTAKALMMPDADLPMDPYCLGVWLGDGHSSGPLVTSSSKDSQHYEPRFKAVGYEWRLVNVDERSNDTEIHSLIPAGRGGPVGLFTQALKAAGVLHNKHIPKDYLRASRKQRLALLQGLMDTDGSVDKRGSTVEFANMNERLALNVMELATSLGEKPTSGLKHVRRKVKGDSVAFRVRWRTHLRCFSIPRKLGRLKLSKEDMQGYRTKQRILVDVRPAYHGPATCITVSSPSHLFLAGPSMIPTHNTTLSRIIGNLYNCDDLSACGKCPSCRDMAKRSHVDYLEVNGSDCGIDRVRELLNVAKYKPRANIRIIAIDECHYLTKAGVQALLKDLEEPPSTTTMWILSTTDPDRIPTAETVAGRCQRLELSLVPLRQLAPYVLRVGKSEKMKWMDKAAAKAIAEASGGRVRDAIQLIEAVDARAGGGADVAKLVSSAALGVAADESRMAMKALLGCYAKTPDKVAEAVVDTQDHRAFLIRALNMNYYLLADTLVGRRQGVWTDRYGRGLVKAVKDRAPDTGTGDMAALHSLLEKCRTDAATLALMDAKHMLLARLVGFATTGKVQEA